MKNQVKKLLTILIALQAFTGTLTAITVKFTYTKTSNCSPAIVRFTNNSTQGPGITYTWNFGLGAVNTTTDIQVKEQVYTKPGDYKVTLKVTDGFTTDSISEIITISKGPAASFTADHFFGCPPLTVSFTNTSKPGDSEISGATWDFRNGEIREGNSVQYNFTSTGSFDIFLKVTDRNGCTSSLESENVITLRNKPKVAFAASDTFSCTAPMTVSFLNSSTGTSDLKYLWNFGNGQTSAEFSNSTVYNTNGLYDVRLKATDIYGCTDSLVKKSYIKIGYAKGSLNAYDGRNKLVTRSFICDGNYRFVYSDPNLPDYVWKITDNDVTTTIKGKSWLNYQVKGTGKITVKIIYGKTGACTDSISATFTKSYIKASFALADTMYCGVPQKVNLNNSSVNADRFSWYVADRLVSTDKSATYSFSENDIPQTTYKQEYGHEVYLNKVLVKLVASNAGICFDSVTRNVYFAKPVARFMPDKVSGCVPLQVTLSDSSKSAFSISSYSYNIGGTIITSSDKTPVKHTITVPGVYNVYEVIKTSTCTDTSHLITITAGDKITPDFSITPAEVCNGGTIHITDNTSDYNKVSLWRLFSHNLFDLSFKNRPDTLITVLTDTTGNKSVSLMTDFNGCISEITKNDIFRIKGPAGSFTGSFSCDSSLSYGFRSSMTSSSSLTWNIDTAVVYGKDSVRYRFPVSGDYIVKLSVSDLASGCDLSKTKIIKARSVMAAFAVNDTIFCAGDTVKLDASGSRDYIKECYNEGFLWNFGDDSPPRRTFDTTWNQIYSSKGKYIITLKAFAENGCIDSTKKTVHVFRPEGTFTADNTSGCLPSLGVNFTNTSTDTTIVGWIWNFGDNVSDSTGSIKIKHIFTSDREATFYSSLTVYDGYQCSSSYALPINMTDIKADFQASDNAICSGQTVTFVPASDSLKVILWDFGDGAISTSTSSHTYLASGQYAVSLIASRGGCRDTISKPDYISVEKANAGFTASDSVLYCYPGELTFTQNSQGDSRAVDYLWTFDSKVLADRTASKVKYTFTKPGKHNVLLTVRTVNGCQANSTKKITVLGPAARITVLPREICYNNNVYFAIDSLVNVNSFKWIFGDGSTSTANPVAHKYTSRGKIVPTLQLVSGTCTAINVLDTIKVATVKANFTTPDSLLAYCEGARLNLYNLSKYSNTWKWFVDNVQVSTGYNLTNISFSSTGAHNVRLIAREPGGCSDTLTKTYSIYPNPVFKITGDSAICAGKTSASLIVKKNTGDRIRWTPVTGVSDPSAFNITVKIPISAEYTARVTNANGCSSSQVKKIMVNEPYNLTRSPFGDTTIFLGEKIQLSVKTSSEKVSYLWSPRDWLSCYKCSDPWVTPAGQITYDVQLTDGCFDITEKFNIDVIADFYLEAPAAFTPNGDSNNDLFIFESKNIRSFTVNIFNRWGETVYTGNDLQKGWDGYVKGHLQNSDTYKYSVKAETIHGYRFEKSGELLLIR